MVGNLALCRTEGPFMCRVNVSTPLEKLHAGTVGLGEPNYITAEFLCGTSEGQSSHQVNVSDDGSFAVSYKRIMQASVKHEITTVPEPISTRSSPPSLRVLAPSEISLLHGTPLPQSQSGTVRAAYVGDPITLRADVADGPAAQLCWLFSHREGDKKVGVERTREGLNSSLVWTFLSRGACIVTANASNECGWTQKIINSVPVCPAFADLQVTIPKMIDRSVSIYTASQTYPTNTDVTFLALTDLPEPLDFLWNFGDSTTTRTSSRNVTKRYYTPGKYNITVLMSDGRISLTSGLLSILIQRAVKLNKLYHQASILRNQTTTVSCRVNAGTDVSFLWNFGDGTTRAGQSTEQHVFLRTGEFLIQVTVSNRVSRASLSSIIFVLDHPCQPPPVKNMGPLKLQVRRRDIIHLGVSYEADIQCDTLRGLHYTWTLFDSAGHVLLLPDAHKQSLVLPGHLLHYDTYTAICKVKIVGSVVYSNYSLRVQVIPSPPVASIQGGTNIFINNRNNAMVTLDGRNSYNPDFPLEPFSFKWMCEPVSSIKSSCFNHDVPAYSALLTFPVSFLKQDFDQFHFTLTVHSGELSASTQAFVTLTPNVISRLAVSCLECEGDQVNSDQPISVKAICEDCEVPSNQTQYTWTLHLVNASSKPVLEVPFCDTVDLSAPTTIKETTSTSLSELYPHRLNALGQREIESIIDYDSSADWDSADVIDGQDDDIPLPIVEEGDPGISAGRPTDLDVQTLSLVDDPSFNPESHDSEGSNLFEARPRQVIPKQTLIDLPRDPIEAGLLASYTYTGLTTPLLSFKPFSLKPGSLYLLEVMAKSQNSILGRTQLFFRTKPIPKGMTCQVQPSQGVELFTHFSIFCTSGREDLLYEYSFNVGSEDPRMLYRGRNFQYYFSLPSGHPIDDYKVTVYTKIQSSVYGSATKLCPVTIQVRPSFFRDVPSHNPDVVLSQSGLKNLSALILFGNSVEICNYVSVLTGILNRLSLDSQADQHTQGHMRNVLICTMCELESSEQDTMVDKLGILRDLLQVTRQVTLASAKQVLAHVKAISGQLSRPSAQKRCQLDQKTLNTLLAVLSYSLEAAVTAYDVTTETSTFSNATCKVASDPQDGFNPGKDVGDSSGDDLQTSRSRQLVENILQTASDLMLKHTLFSKIQEHKISSSFISLNIAQQNSSVSIIRSDSVIFYIPSPLLRSFRGECVLSLITELKHSPWIWAAHPGKISGPVVDLTLYKCSTRRKISLRSFVQPIFVAMKPRKDKKESASKHFLLRKRINYHSFNISQEHLQQAIQLTVTFTLPSKRPFPIMLLFRMFAKPVPSMHHLHKLHLWETNITRITLPPSYLNTPGIGYLALLNGDFGKQIRHKRLSSQINYTLTVETSQCVSFDGLKGAWTPLGCGTHQADSTDAVNCSCHQLRALTVVQKQIQSSYEAADLDQFLSESADVTVLVVLLLCACLYVPAWVACRRADVISQQNGQVHYLNDNCRLDPHLYAVTIHTGLCSAYRPTAKVYVALYGANGNSQTRELYVPGCTLFRRNSRDTFILSAADHLGPVWGVHIWHDNSGPSPHLYLKLVEVSEVGQANMREQTWLFVSQCWLSVSKGDGQVERMLRIRGIGLAQMLRLMLCDYLADFHTWMSVYSCPRPHSFTCTQRLSVCLLLFAGYAGANALIISQMDEMLHFQMGITAGSLTMAILSVAAGLPMATMVAFLFRMQELKLTMNEDGTQTFQGPCEVDNTNTFRKKYQDAEKDSGIQTEVIQKQMGLEEESFSKDGSEEGSFRQAACFKQRRFVCIFDKLSWRKMRPTWLWCYYLAWTLCLLLSFAGLLLAAVLGLRFNSSKLQLWLQSLFISLLLCFFLIQPIAILAAAVTVSIRYRNRTDFYRPTKIIFKAEELISSAFQSERCLDLKKLLGQRQRARFLKLVRPPIVAELKLTRARRRREALIHKTLRDLCVFVAMLLLMLCISNSSSVSDHYRLNKAVRKQIIGRRQEPAFMSIQKYGDWQKWMQSSLLNLLYKNTSAAMKYDVFQQSSILIGEPVVWMTQLCTKRCLPAAHAIDAWCAGCDIGPSAAVRLGRSKSDATYRLKALQCDGCLILKVQFTMYSPAPDLFTSVTLLAEQSPTGTMLPSAAVHSVKVYQSATQWDYLVTVCQLLFLCLSLLHLCVEVSTAWQKGLKGYCTAPYSWLHVTLQIANFLHFYHNIYRSVEAMKVMEVLQRNNGKEHVDVSLLAAREQHIRSLHGVLLLLLTVKCATMLKVNKRSTTALACLIPNLMSAFILLQVVRSLHGLFTSWGLHSGCSFLSSRILCLSIAAVMMAVISSSNRKRQQSRKQVCTWMELGRYLRSWVYEFTGRERRARPVVQSKTYYLEEFETLVDELLLRLNRLQATLPPIDHRVHIDDSPGASLQKEPSSKNSARSCSTESEPQVNCSGQAECHSVQNGALERQTNHITRTSCRCLLCKNMKCGKTIQATPTEVLVEALIHNEPL
ncbi:polycystin-1-like protein 1 [Syngnathus scovelli]|uniref:polycystin-1-like protein 1 n=1 Tax=Syngnathus scovelli TaxID=161590 RepID=UPI00210FCF42|nr:polycystic kidney disease 1 like 1 isoform X1 [Syngnathus scovelli]